MISNLRIYDCARCSGKGKAPASAVLTTRTQATAQSEGSSRDSPKNEFSKRTRASTKLTRAVIQQSFFQVHMHGMRKLVGLEFFFFEDIATKAAGSSSNAGGSLTAEPTSPLSPSSPSSSSNTSGTRAVFTRTPSQNYKMLLKSNKLFVGRGSDCVPLRCLFDSVGLCLTKKSWTRTFRHRQ